MFTKHFFRFLLFLSLVLFTFACEKTPPTETTDTKEVKESAPLYATVAVSGGTIEGVEQDGIFIYKGIPFAAPPVGDLRWKSPQPVIPWEGVKKTDKFAPGPMQDTSFGAMLGGPQEISEDCLYLNVWTGAKKTDERRPVMVWIYGGGFGIGMTSSPAYDGASLAQKGVVLVSVAYRVGPMGFLAHPELSAESGRGSGAYGIQDQIAGLRWVRDNIAGFGGDPSNVTIFGESAGGISVSMLTASPLAKGLFHRAISQSGGSMTPPRMTLAQAEEQGKKYLENLGANTIAEARSLGAEEIQKNTKGMGSFWPVADGATIVENQYEVFETGSFNDTPVLAGTNSNEGGLFVMQPVTSDGFVKMVQSQYALGAEEILKAYPHATDEEATQSAKDLMRETAFAWPTWAWATLQSRNGRNKAYVYYFDHRVEGVPGGANHAAEIPYVFGNLGGPGPMNSRPATDEDRALGELISAYWINFAKTGDPNGDGLPEWPAFNEKENKVMYIDGDTGAKIHPDLDKIMAFDAYFKKVREDLKK
ncbi:MAG: carboxylesterase family protein [Deltaproteobacteria bacterium]|nr:carboxylesterase family protein [Deltaproteobacteria bacterium]